MSARRDDGSLLTLGDLPELGQRWTRLRKKAVLDCIEMGLIGAKDIIRRYGLTPEELDEWRASVLNRRAPVVWYDRPRTRFSGRTDYGRLSIDLDAQFVQVDGEIVELSPSEWRILLALAEADGAVVSTAMIMGALYPNPRQAAGAKIADVLVCRLRKKLGLAGDVVSAVWGRGYYLSS